MPRPAKMSPRTGVLIIGGFAAPRLAFRKLVNDLRTPTRAVSIFSHHAGLDCSEATYTALARELVELERINQKPSTIVAYSRGGQLAKVAAIRMPQLIHAVITLGAPFAPGVAQLGAATRRKILTLGQAGSLGLPGVVTQSCLAEDGCCQRFWNDLTKPWPDDIPLRPVYGRSDNTVRADHLDTHVKSQIVWLEGNHYQLLSSATVRQITRRFVDSIESCRPSRNSPGVSGEIP
jgi:pimeloyl-ACP methyl ester carboxylesterase